MYEPISHDDIDLSNDSPDVCVLSPVSVSCSSSVESTAAPSQNIDNIPKTIKNNFFINITKYETNWSGECILCKKIQYDSIGVTSNMNRHVKSQHKTAYHEWINQLDQLSNKSQKRMSDVFMKTNETKRKSSNSKSFYNNNHPRPIQLSQSILENLIVDLGLPLSIVERDAFIKFMSVIDPKFAITSRRTLSRTTIPRLFTAMNDELKKFCNQSNFISLTLDIWTDRRLRAFFAMTGHAFVDNTLKSYVLCFLPLHGSHTANLLLQTYENVISMFDIQTKLVRLVTDNAANNIKAFENLIIPGFEHYFNIEDDDNDEIESDIDLDGFSDDDDAKEESYHQVIHDNAINIIESIKHSFDNVAANSESLRIPCFAHTIQLVVNDGLKQISSIQSALVKVSKIAKLSHTSTIFAEKLEHIGKSIPKANKTRWNSQFSTVEKVLNIPPSELNEILVFVKHKDFCLLAKDYQMLNEFLSLLTLFAEATILTQSENTPSISFIAPTVLTIYHDLLYEQSNILYTSSLCSSLLNSLVSRFGGLLEELGVIIDKSILQKSSSELYRDQIFIYSPFLDGKFKLHWIMESSLPLETKNILCEKIKNLICDNCIVLQHNNSSTTTPRLNADDDDQSSKTATAKTTPKRKSLFSNIERKNIKKQKLDNLAFIKDEINIYLNDDDNDSNRFILIDQSIKYKALNYLAKKVFTVPATSSPVERVFSQSGFIFRQHRSKMSRKTLQMLTILKCNQGLM
ncbi:unnamed protein product [Rotaria magnacalcarata]|uniref:HAT C-terminal dimerisation domain-containing protein n=4 Tax=Rotaria magnacalcarata TaxID=392030 RepID=A0A815RV86_9BILA|nr:unnamed protein product [Rotaria magnacalcarata]CAF1677687.1 unnamed protein product [Rotaria magnacalcarata]CAF4121794.1 unnamed protein product [Rotaria magnacalcarata]CAF4159330.1 unnamed protein product [Rotaria magnacalcarata]